MEQENRQQRPLEDDGSLEWLNIPRDENSRSFNCDETTQSKLMNKTFWVVDYIENVKTRYSNQKGSEGQMLVKIKMNRDDPESAAKKFFTGSEDIKYVMRQIKERNAFPRRVTLCGSGNRYFFDR